MKNRLLAQLPQHKTCLCSIYNPHLYIVDWKDYNKGAVEISGAQRNVINAVHILNENNVKVFFDAFPENALPITKKKRSRQCECVVFPITCDQDEWILLKPNMQIVFMLQRILIQIIPIVWYVK